MALETVQREFMWAQKYRPQTIQDVILPEEIKKQVQGALKKGKSTNMMFDGPPGCGKTTLAHALAKEINAEVLFLNGSGAARGIDTVRSVIPNFCASLSMDYDNKIVFFDEFDYLTPEAFAALRGTIEQFSSTVAFIATSNNKLKIPEAIRSRFVEVDFRIPDEERKNLQKQLMHRCIEILKAEGYPGEIGKEQMTVIAELIQTHFPNNRKILNTLQVMATSDEGITAAGLTVSHDSNFDEMAEYLTKKQWKKMREWVVMNADVDPSFISNWFWKYGEEKFGVQAMPGIILNIDDWQRYIATSRNPIIATTALFTRIMQGLK